MTTTRYSTVICSHYYQSIRAFSWCIVSMTPFERKDYNLLLEETDEPTRTCPWSLRLRLRLRINTGNCAVFEKKLGDAGPQTLGEHVEWVFSADGLDVHVCTMFQKQPCQANYTAFGDS